MAQDAIKHRRPQQNICGLTDGGQHITGGIPSMRYLRKYNSDWGWSFTASCQSAYSCASISVTLEDAGNVIVSLLYTAGASLPMVCNSSMIDVCAFTGENGLTAHIFFPILNHHLHKVAAVVGDSEHLRPYFVVKLPLVGAICPRRFPASVHTTASPAWARTHLAASLILTTCSGLSHLIAANPWTGHY